MNGLSEGAAEWARTQARSLRAVTAPLRLAPSPEMQAKSADYLTVAAEAEADADRFAAYAATYYGLADGYREGLRHDHYRSLGRGFDTLADSARESVLLARMWAQSCLSPAYTGEPA